MLEDSTEEEDLPKSITFVFFKLTIRQLWSNQEHINFKSLI